MLKRYNTYHAASLDQNERQCQPPHPFSAPLSCSTNIQTSVYVLYRGVGATRITPGSLLSHTIPAFCSLSDTFWSKPGLSNRLNCAPLACGSDGVMIWNWRVSSVVSFSSKYSRYAVNWIDLFLSWAMEVSSKTDRVAQRDARSTTEGFESWNPPAPGIGLNSGRSQYTNIHASEPTRQLTVIHLKPH